MSYKVEAWPWCADYCKKNKHSPYDSYFWDKAMLEYRREHNIFEVGDLVVGLASATDEIFEIETTSNKPNRKGKKTYAVTFAGKEGLLVGLQYRHATDEEIKAGHRL